MKGIRTMILLATAASPAWAIEPPVKARPIQPGEPLHGAAPDHGAVAESEVAPERRAEPAPAFGELQEEQPYLGVILEPLPELLADHLGLAEGEGVVVSEVVSGGPAENAGLKVNDVIVSIDGQQIASVEDVRNSLREKSAGDSVNVSVVQSGERREVPVELKAVRARIVHPRERAPMQGFDGRRGPDSERFNQMLGELPDRHIENLRRAMERSMEAFENFEQQAHGYGGLQHELLQRMERGFNGIQDGIPHGEDLRSETTIRLMDDQGSIEMKTRDGQREAKVFDESGKLLWEGPYDSETNLDDVPDAIRSRLERMNFDIGGNGMRFHFGPERFRELDEMESR